MKLVLLVSVSFLFSSCYQFQYLTVSSPQLSKDKSNNLVVENDTLKLTYDFSGHEGPVKITIYNKLNEPLEINWKKSALIVNDKAFSYYSPNLLLNGTMDRDSLRSLSDIRADIYVKEPSQFIPPKSSISKTTMPLPQHHLVPLPANLKKEIYGESKFSGVKFIRAKYTSGDSPISFRSYLSFNSSGNNGPGFSVDHNFYVAEIWQSSSEPMFFSQELVKRGDVFYLRGR